MEKLSTPIAIGRRKVKNRVVVPPMADFGMTEKDGQINSRHIEHYRAYAEGGAGLVIVEACAVTKLQEPRNTVGVFDDACLSGLTDLARAATEDGTAALVQIMESGGGSMPEKSFEQTGRERLFQYMDDFVSAALRCRQAGFDGVELHAAHGTWLNKIIETSARTDEYGGSLENRVRILTELIQRIKTACGDGFIAAARFGNPNYGELVRTASLLEQAGADLLDVSAGTEDYRDVPGEFPLDGRIYAASLVKRQVRVPVICVGNIVSKEQAEQALEYADLVAVGRGHLCDPAWMRKSMEGGTLVPCRRCRACMWFTDGRKCPAVRERKNRENTIDYNADGKIDDFDRAIEYELYGVGRDRLEDGES